MKQRSGSPDEMCDFDWQLIASAPFDCDLELAVIESGEIHRLVIQCRRTPVGWADAISGRPVDVHPTHWRYWRWSHLPV
ncbi:MAG: hypothetical protein AB7O60_13580 [Variibacter sp.]